MGGDSGRGCLEGRRGRHSGRAGVRHRASICTALSERSWLWITGVVALLLAVTVPSAVAAQASTRLVARTAQLCPTIAYIGAAGSGELEHKKDYPTYADMGAEVDAMASTLHAALRAHGLSLAATADSYPAAPTTDLYPSFKDVLLSAGDPERITALWSVKVSKYFISIETGIRTAERDMKNEVQQCPNTDLVLAGYSQGAIVMHQAELRLAGNQAVMSRIAGTLLLGDGDRSPNSQATLFGNGVPEETTRSLEQGEGIRQYFRLPKSKDVVQPATTAEICNAKDIVCDFKLSHDDTPDRIKKAVGVHTSYAVANKNGSIRSYSPLLSQAANWLAAKIIAAHVAPAPPVAPAPAPPAPSPTVPSTGPTLVYTGDSAGNPDAEDTSFDGFSQATGQPTDVEETLPSDLYAYRCVLLDDNESFDGDQISQLSSYLGAGGTILAVGEHEGTNFDSADAALNGVASGVGATGLSLNDDSYDDGDDVTYAINPSPLTTGVEALGDNWASSLDVQPPALTLVDTTDDATIPLVAEQTVGSGTFVLAGDSNIFSDNNSGFYTNDDNGTFAQDLCP